MSNWQAIQLYVIRTNPVDDFSNLRSKRYHKLVSAQFNSYLLHLVDERPTFGAENRSAAMEKT